MSSEPAKDSTLNDSGSLGGWRDSAMPPVSFMALSSDLQVRKRLPEPRAFLVMTKLSEPCLNPDSTTQALTGASRNAVRDSTGRGEESLTFAKLRT